MTKEEKLVRAWSIAATRQVLKVKAAARNPDFFALKPGPSHYEAALKRFSDSPVGREVLAAVLRQDNSHPLVLIVRQASRDAGWRPQ